MRTKQFAGLDLVRFLAAFTVAFYHLSFSSWAKSDDFFDSHGIDFTSLKSAIWLNSYGWIGVPVFFVLSGFVISYSASGATAMSFARNRAVRLLPGAWICATIALAVSPLKDQTYAANIPLYFRTIFFFPMRPWINGVYWTLAIEISFYAGIYFLLALKRFSWLPGVISLVALASMGYLLGQAFGKHVNVPLVDHQTSNRIIELLLLKHGIYFAIGVWLWHIRFHGGSPIKWSWLVLLVVAAFLDVWREVIHAREFYAQPIPIMGPLVAFAIAMVLMFYSIFKESAQRPWVSKVMRQIGLSTYPLYLVHTALGVSLMTVMLKHRFTPWLSVFSGLVLSIVGAVVIALLIEPTLQRVLRSILTPKAVSSASYKGGSRQTRQNPR